MLEQNRWVKRSLFISLLGIVGLISYTFAAATAWLYPINDGTYEQWDAQPATANHYTNVDENPCDATGDFVYTTVAGERDSYGIDISSVPNGATIKKITIEPCASSNQQNGTSSTLAVFYRWGGSNSENKTYTLGVSDVPAVLSESTWTNLNLSKITSSTLEIGIAHIVGTRGSKVSNLRVIISYLL